LSSRGDATRHRRPARLPGGAAGHRPAIIDVVYRICIILLRLLLLLLGAIRVGVIMWVDSARSSWHPTATTPDRRHSIVVRLIGSYGMKLNTW